MKSEIARAGSTGVVKGPRVASASDAPKPEANCAPGCRARRLTVASLCLFTAGVFLYRACTFDFADYDTAGVLPATMCVGMSIVLLLIATATLGPRDDLGPS